MENKMTEVNEIKEINEMAETDMITEVNENKDNYESKTDIKSLCFEELKDSIADLGEKPFRASQIYEWMHVKLVRNFDEMTNLSKDLRRKLQDHYSFTSLKLLDRQISAIDGTQKFLFELEDGNTVESVWMKYKHGDSVCISSQVGCRMGCRFCASTLDGLTRSLRPSEMLDQIYAITKLTGERVSNAVVMGTGEPFDNFDNLLTFIKMLTDDKGLNISQRNITVSTCGLVDKIYELADKKLQITLALSLHATTDEKRKKLMPIAYRYTIAQLMDACLSYYETTGRRVTFEYSMVKGVNDSNEDAVLLSRLAKKVHAHVNLIPVNPIKERDFTAPDLGYVHQFKNKLENQKVPVTVRREMGRDIDGACGQLRKRHIDSKGQL